MSASLVGSEMCIRDSAASSSKEARASPRSRGTRSRCAWPPAVLARQAPVSYTHLTLPTICSV
eukprot:250556-Alexandrium_andersonii.AAC.1